MSISSSNTDTTQPWSQEPAEWLPIQASMSLEIGDLVADRYRIEGNLGKGGMGAVYRVQDLELDEEVALKVLARDVARGTMLERFKQEIRLARRIVHPNVCQIYDFGAWGELKFITMELLSGRTLDKVITDPDGVSLDVTLALSQGILAGLGAAHKLGIVHRDIKPQNVMVAADQRPVIMDFGIARELTSSGLTMTGEVVGTPEYMAPEHLLGKDVDHRCDIYAMGIVLFELTTGQLPFDGETVFAIARAQISEPPPLPTDFNSEIPLWLQDLILKMLAKEPDDRFQSVEQVIAELTDARSEEGQPPVAVERLAESRRIREPDRSAVPEQRTKEATGRSRLLLIGQDFEFLQLVEHYLANGGVEVVAAPTITEGTLLLRAHGADLVCLDFRLPEMDGLQAATVLQRFGLDRQIPLFMTTTEPDSRYAKQAARVGVDRFFTKPVDIELFLRAVGEELAP